MNELQIFNSGEFGEIRTIEIDGKPYFVGTDVAKALGYNNVSKMTGIPVSSVRAGIVYGWLPVGVAIQNNKPAKSLSGGSRITYIVSPRKVYEVTGHVWRGKEALKKKNKTDEHIEE